MTFRILCLDGGGIKGVFTAAVLARLEESTGLRTLDHFDLIAGTSTGGILAIGLGLGLSAQELLDFYVQRGPIIFPSTGRIAKTAGVFRQIFSGPKLSGNVLREELVAVLGDRKFGESKARLLIPAYDAVGSRIYVFKTAHLPRFVNDIKLPAADVALATSAAPTYFAAASILHGGRFVDGGVWANCPAMVAITEAVAMLGQSIEDIRLLSVGTTSEPFSIAKHDKASALQWNVGLLDLMFEAQAAAVKAQASVFLGSRMHRIDYSATSGRFPMDDASERAINDLAVLGRSEAEKQANLAAVARDFLNGQTTSFTPCQTV